MNNYLLQAYGLWSFKILAALGTVIFTVRHCRRNPYSRTAGLLQISGNLWLALLLLLGQFAFSQLIIIPLFRLYGLHPPAVLGETLAILLNVFAGVIYGLSGCLLASPPKGEERFSYGISLTVTIMLTLLITGLTMMFSVVKQSATSDWLLFATVAGFVGLLGWLAIRGREAATAEPQPESTTKPAQRSEYTILWLLVGLAPIPIFLIGMPLIIHMTTFPAILFGICALFSLAGGLGCVGGIQRPGVRVIVGLFLALFFLLLSWTVAAFQACSGFKG